ncbi:hypothetical protein L1887_14588 [Cichorium endivia]|nr:hypothetical protein L1887_14588 [Cichorium endivia]
MIYDGNQGTPEAIRHPTTRMLSTELCFTLFTERSRDHYTRQRAEQAVGVPFAAEAAKHAQQVVECEGRIELMNGKLWNQNCTTLLVLFYIRIN